MHAISLCVWYMWKSFINGIKRAWKILFIIVCICVMLVGGIILITSLTEDSSTSKEDSSEHQEIDEKEDEINTKFDIIVDDNGDIILYMLGEEHMATDTVPEFIFSVIALIVIVLAVMSGAKKGVDIFTMPDVNYIFPAPMKPQSVLLFKIVGQIGTAIIGSMYIVGQVPNLVKIFGLSMFNVVMLVFIFILLNIISKFISVLTYCLLCKNEKLKRYFSKYGYMVGFIPVVICAFLYKIIGMSLYESICAVFCGKISRIVPFWGWIKALAMYVLADKWLYAGFFFIVIIVGLVMIVWITWNLKVDFYEDALEGATTRQKAVEAIKDSSKGAVCEVERTGIKKKKWERIRNKALLFDGYEGAKAIFGKNLINRKRFYALGGLWSDACSTYFLFALGIGVIIKIVRNLGNEVAIFAIPIVIMVLIFLRSFGNPISDEMDHIFIYMIPDNPFKLLGWGMVSHLIDGLLDLLPVTLLMFIINDFNMVAWCWYLVLVSTHLFFGTIALLVDTVFTFYLPTAIVNIMQLILRFVPILPLIIGMVMGALKGGLVGGLITVSIVNIIFTILCFLPCPYFLFRGRK